MLVLDIELVWLKYEMWDNREFEIVNLKHVDTSVIMVM